MTGTDSFWAAGRSITGFQNGLAISGDYLSAPRSFLGIAGLIYLYGFDGFLYSVGFLVAFLTVMFLLAERMRNAGKYTIADVLSFRLQPAAGARRGGARHAGRRRLLPHRADGRRGRAHPGAHRHRLQHRGASSPASSCSLRRLRRHARHDVGADHQGRPADGRHRRDVALRARARRLEPDRPLQRGRGEHDGEESTFCARAGHVPRARRSTRSRSASRSCSAPRACRTSSCGSSRCRTRRPRAARSSTRSSSSAASTSSRRSSASARAPCSGEEGVEAAGKGGNLAAPNLAQELGGGAGTVGGDAFLAIIAAVAFATILAVVAGLVLSASGAVAHDIWSNVIRHGKDSEHEEVWAGPDRRGRASARSRSPSRSSAARA